MSGPTLPQVPMASPQAGHGCGCGHRHDDGEEPVWEVHSIPRQVRHAAILGAFAALAPGQSFVLLAPHLPRPLLAELEHQGPVQVDVLSQDPAAWRIRLTKPAPSTQS